MKLKFLLCLLIFSIAHGLYAADLRGDTIDIQSYQLKLDIRDFDTHILYGSALIGIKAKQNGTTYINFDLFKLSVDSVKVNGKREKFDYNDSLLHVPFLKALNAGDSATLLVYYHGKPGVQPGDFGGFYWDDQYAFNIGVSFTCNPHNYGRVWFPCFDNFDVRSHYEYFITTRPTDKAFCNGLLLDTKTEDSAIVWHWKLKETIPSYLASVAVAAYQTLRDTVNGINGTIPIELAVLPQDSAVLKKDFQHLHQAFHILEHYWGPYQWQRVGYCIVPFQEGAMEHATNIAFMRNYLYLYERECETTMAHELSHHWFGNLVTCNSAADMWLNEGWATYSQSLFIEGLYGSDSANQYRRDARLTELQMAHINDGGYLAVSGVPSGKTYGNTVYQKGGDVIHTLRYYLGDSTFFSCVRGYLNQYAFKTANTIQLRDCLSACSGKDLTDFFNDWVLSPGYPHFSIADKYIKRVKGEYEVYINISQRLSHAPALYKNVPVTVSYFDKNMKRKDERIYINGECTTYQATQDFKAEFIALDFDEHLAQAISGEWHILRDTGLYDFGSALMGIKINAIKDSSLMQVEHHWLPPTGNVAHAFSNIRLNNTRYWSVDGVFDPAMKATGIFEYSALTSDHLDNGFITNEDSLVIMYRPDEVSDWQQVNKFLVEKGDNDSDRVGVVAVYPLMKGDYALAVYDTKLANGIRETNSCEPIKNCLKTGNGFDLSFDKASDQLLIAFGKHIFEQAEVSNVNGKIISEQKIKDEANVITLRLINASTETYIVTLTTKTGKRIIKKLTN